MVSLKNKIYISRIALHKNTVWLYKRIFTNNIINNINFSYAVSDMLESYIITDISNIVLESSF